MGDITAATLKRRGLLSVAMKPVLTPEDKRLLRKVKHDASRKANRVEKWK